MAALENPEVKKYTHKKEKNKDNWLFHDDYFTEQTRFLPMSQQITVKNRLMQSKALPIAEADIKTIHPVIEAKIKAICDSYTKKQVRAREYSQKIRKKPEASVQFRITVS